MAENKQEKLKNQIWITRTSRINAERRILNKEHFIQFVNIYYSCITIIFSIMSYVNKDDKLSLLTIYMTISLLISIMYLSSQNYTLIANKFRDNYTELQKLEFRLNHISEDDTDEMKEIEKEYCTLLKGSENHIPFDYACTIFGSNSELKKRFNGLKIYPPYFWGQFWRFVVKLFITILPIVLFYFRSYI